MDDLHPYDNIERRFRHTDRETTRGLEIIAKLLGLPHLPSIDGTLYDLSFYSGGIGVHDRLAVTLRADPIVWGHVNESFRLVTPEGGVNEPFYAEDFNWLITNEENVVATRLDTVRFVNDERRPFQRECVTADRLLFDSTSDVNDWTVFWGDDSVLNYVAYSQG